MIAIVDYGVGNLGSVANMFKRVGANAGITSSHADIRRASGVILPGVGHFDAGMQRLKDSGLVDVLNEVVAAQSTPVLGICLGMQLLARGSEEGSEPGLGWLPADVKKFRFDGADATLPVPHMGWNDVRPVGAGLFSGFPAEEARFYFVHSFYVDCDDVANVAGWTRYGHDFAASVQRGKVYGAQFHPEKSHRFGLRLLSNFASLCSPKEALEDAQGCD